MDQKKILKQLIPCTVNETGICRLKRKGENVICLDCTKQMTFTAILNTQRLNNIMIPVEGR